MLVYICKNSQGITDLQFLQLSLDGIHVFDEGVEVGHIEVHGLQPLEEALVVSKKLQPASVKGSDGGLVLGVAEEGEREGGGERGNTCEV